jgi:hypothetical protein
MQKRKSHDYIIILSGVNYSTRIDQNRFKSIYRILFIFCLKNNMQNSYVNYCISIEL